MPVPPATAAALATSPVAVQAALERRSRRAYRRSSIVLRIGRPQASKGGEMTPEERLTELGLELPEPPAGVGAYVPWVKTGNLVVTSFQLPWRGDELLLTGRLGDGLTVEQGYEVARQCALNGIAQLRQAAGELSRVRQIVRLEGHVGCSEDFDDIPAVLNGASDLVNAVFEERGRHARTALGHVVMPLSSPVMVGFWAEVEQ
jgi:enamine deaminase RidA (YjgF/YER057c/UK114 family)